MNNGLNNNEPIPNDEYDQIIFPNMINQYIYNGCNIIRQQIPNAIILLIPDENPPYPNQIFINNRFSIWYDLQTQLITRQPIRG